MDGQPIRDPVLLAEVVLHRFFHLALVLVVASCQSANVSLRDRLVVLDRCAAVDADPAISIFDQHAHTRISREVPIFDSSLGAVHDDDVSIEEVPHDREVRRSIRIARADDRETLLFEECALRLGQP